MPKVITIASGGTAGNAIKVAGCRSIDVFPPAVLDATTFKLQANLDGGATWKTVIEGAVDVAFTASKLRRVIGNWQYVRILAGAATAADRVFTVLTR